MRAIFLDLDGTLMDSRPGILASIRHALAAMGADPREGEDLSWCVGPPLWESFAGLLGADADTDRAVALYRQHYTTEGMFVATVYDGVPAMLDALSATGAQLWVATSKPHAYANRIVDHFGLRRHLDGLFGSELNGRNSDKTDLLAHALAQTGMTAAGCAMVGDRRHDVAGARGNGLPCIGALWGYGGAAELAAAGADATAGHPAEVHGHAARLAGRAA